MDLITATPQLCKVKSTPAANYLLHEACLHKAPIEVVKKMVEINVNAVTGMDRSGNTPLDVALSTTGVPNAVVELLLNKTPGGGAANKAAEGVMKSAASRRRKKERRSTRNTLDALPSLGSKPEGMVMIEGDSLTDFLSTIDGAKASPLAPLASPSVTSLASLGSPGVSLSPVQPPLQRRSSFSQMVKSLFVSDNKSWRGASVEKDWSDNVDIDYGNVARAVEQESKVVTGQKVEFDVTKAGVDVLAAMASIHRAGGNVGTDGVPKAAARSKRDRQKQQRRSF